MNKFDEALGRYPLHIHEDNLEPTKQALRLASFMQEHKEYFVWQPISEAPRDGEIVRVKSDDTLKPMDAWFGQDDLVRDEELWLTGDGDSWSIGYYYTPCHPTHYMRIPTEEIQEKLKEMLNEY